VKAVIDVREISWDGKKGTARTTKDETPKALYQKCRTVG
jgi:hypothetical protein